MKIKIYHVDAFTNTVFHGNPAAVCPLENWLNDETLLKIAGENFLPETVFYVKRDDCYEIRWFSPLTEVNLCGHATLAASYVLFNYENHLGDTIYFSSRESGKLIVTREDDMLSMNFPTDTINEVELTNNMVKGFNFRPVKVFKGKTDYMFIFDNQQEIEDLKPDLPAISKLDARGVIVTSKGVESDFVSRFFAPRIGVNEDPVCGSAHTSLTPYWSSLLNKTELSAIQLSSRKGFLKCKYMGDRIEISGSAKLFMKGELEVD